MFDETYYQVDCYCSKYDKPKLIHLLNNIQKAEGKYNDDVLNAKLGIVRDATNARRLKIEFMGKSIIIWEDE